MIRVSVLYPNGPDAKFDHDYYVNKHLPMVAAKLGSALKGGETSKGIGTAEPGAPAPFVAVGHMLFDSVESFQQAFGPHAEPIMSDIPNFTNTTPQIQISEVTSGG